MRTLEQSQSPLRGTFERLAYLGSRMALLAALSGCADRTVGDESGEGSSTGQSSEVGSGQSSGELSVSTTFSTDSGLGDTTTDSSNTSGTTGMDAGTTADASTGFEMSTGTTGELSCIGYDMTDQLPDQPVDGLYSACIVHSDCNEKDGQACFPFGDPDNPDFTFCAVQCVDDADCQVNGLSENVCDVKAKCLPKGDFKVCFLADCGSLTHDFCPQDMFCLNTDLGPNGDSGVCASKPPEAPFVDPSSVAYTFQWNDSGKPMIEPMIRKVLEVKHIPGE